MTRVLLIENDAAIRENLRESFARLRPEFVLAGEALDGETGLQMLVDLRPDVLIIGRHLPFLDGLALWQRGRKLMPWIQAVLVGGEDPEYRRMSAALGVTEYLMRPVTAFALRDALEGAVGRMRMAGSVMRSRVSQARLRVTPQRRENEQKFEKWLREGGRHFGEVQQRGRYCRILRIPGRPDGDWLAADVVRLIEDDFGDGVLAMELEGEVVLLVTGDDPEALEERVYGLAHTIRIAVEHYGGGSVRIGIGACADTSDALRKSYAELRAREPDEFRPVLGDGDCMRSCPGRMPSVSVAGEMMMCADGEIPEAWREAGLDAAITALEMETGVGAPQTQGTPEERMAQLAEWRDAVAPELRELPLSRARYFTALNMGKPGLSAYDVAAHVGMALSRFSVVFMQEMGVSFTEYLIRLRVDAARTLLAGTRTRLSTVAQQVGVPELGRLADMFRDVVGVEIKEYRKKMQ